MATTTIKLQGMHCDGCAQRVKRVLEREPGVREAQVSFAAGEAHVTYDAQATTTEQLRHVIDRAGFGAVVT